MITTTCQICGRPIKTVNGLIAHHGYKRPGIGFQTNSCQGTRHLPYEVSRDHIQTVMGKYRAGQQRLSKMVTDQAINPPAEIKYADRNWNVVTLTKPENFDVFHYSEREPYGYKYTAEIETWAKGIRQIEQVLISLAERYDAWVPTTEKEAL